MSDHWPIGGHLGLKVELVDRIVLVAHAVDRSLMGEQGEHHVVRVAVIPGPVVHERLDLTGVQLVEELGVLQ